MNPAGIVRLFARHRNAGNLLMIMAVVFGIFSLMRLNTQFFPNFEIDIITVTVPWSGASADDIDQNIIEAIEPEVRFLDYVDTVTSFAREGVATISIEYEPNTPMQQALSEVESAVARLTTLPEDAEEPVISRVINYEAVAKLVLYGPFAESSLKAYGKDMRDDLLARGVDQISFFGARDEEIIVEVLPETLRRLNMTIADVAGVIRDTSIDIPSGDVSGSVAKQLRSVGQVTTAEGVAGLEVRSLDTGEKVFIRDLGLTTDTFDDDQPVGRHKGYPAIEMTISRAITADALEVDQIVVDYLAEIEGTLPPSLQIAQYDVQANLIKERIQLLIDNGITGLILVAIVLMLFLDIRLAFWVAVGIPVSMFAALGLMELSGQSINMISLFGIIMTLGIVVDDAIVVGEHSHTLRQQGRNPIDAAEGGALRMLAPVTAASLTTIAGFGPIFMISGIMGEIVAAIPFVVIVVLIASLIECMLILPSHLRESYAWEDSGKKVLFGLARPILDVNDRFRGWFDPKFDAIRDGSFRRFVGLTVRWRYTTLALAVATLIISIGMMAGGRVGFQFFPTPESDIVFANVSFAPGTPRDTVNGMIDELDRAARQTELDLGYEPGQLIVMTFGKVGASQSRDAFSNRTENHLGGMQVELVSSDQRATRTREFITAWREQIMPLPGLERMALSERGGGPPGRELDIRLVGDDIFVLKQAALDVADLLAKYPGVSDVEDDLPEGKRELIIELKPAGRALGFTTQTVANQVRNAFDGAIAKRFPRGDEEVLIRVQYQDNEVTEADLPDLNLQTPSGQQVALSDVVSIRESQGFARIKRIDGSREVSIAAEIDETVTSSQAVISALMEGEIQAIADQYNVEFQFRGKAEERAEAFGDMGVGSIVALLSMYIILAWVFASYSRPLAVMLIIPFGLVGAIVGHFVMDYALTFLSMIALLGLAGILVNDSIILVSTIDERIKKGQSVFAAAVGGAQDRLRAVLLTSMTTIGGLAPLMFETSLQAQFLIPMGITIVFGLMVATVLVLIIVPCIIVVSQDLKWLLGGDSPHVELPPESFERGYG